MARVFFVTGSKGGVGKSVGAIALLDYQTVPRKRVGGEDLPRRRGRFRQQETKQLGMSKTRDADLLGLFVFLKRLELDRNNGRPRGRAFLDLLRGLQPDRREAHRIRRRWCCLDRAGGASPRPETPVSSRCSPRGRRIFCHH